MSGYRQLTFDFNVAQGFSYRAASCRWLYWREAYGIRLDSVSVCTEAGISNFLRDEELNTKSSDLFLLYRCISCGSLFIVST